MQYRSLREAKRNADRAESNSGRAMAVVGVPLFDPPGHEYEVISLNEFYRGDYHELNCWYITGE